MDKATRDALTERVRDFYDGPADVLYRTTWGENLHLGLPRRPGEVQADAAVHTTERMAEPIALHPGASVLDLGCGYGGPARQLASRYGCRVTTTTISREQRAVAVQRVREHGLEDSVTVLLEDYRDLRGRFDKLVTIEMIEAVGWQYFDTFFRRCAELLRPDGLMLLQAITIADRAYELEKATRSFVKQLIFPAGCLPSVKVIRRCVERVTDLRMLDLEDITDHYPETLRRWRENFVRSEKRAAELGYDQRFRRLWELYFSWCEGGFRERRIGDVQALLAKPSYRGYGLPLRRNRVLTET